MHRARDPMHIAARIAYGDHINRWTVDAAARNGYGLAGSDIALP
jgi:hypothetical protein